MAYDPDRKPALEDFDDLDHENYDFQGCMTRADRYGPYELRDVVAAIRKSYGNFHEMASLLGRNRSRVRDYIFANAIAKSLFDDVREGMIDQVETNVFKSAIAGDAGNQRFVLSTLAKDRGYSTRVESTGAGGGPLQVREITSDMTPQEAAEAYAATLHSS